jgi:small GTP-binding protein
MGLKDRLGRLADKLGNTLQDRVGGFVEDSLMTEAVKRALYDAEQDLSHSRFADADRRLSALESQRAGGPKTKLLRGVFYLYQGDGERATHHLEAALQQRQSTEGFYFLALAAEQRQRWADARNALLAALSAQRDPPMQFDLRFALGRIYLAMGRLDRAERELGRALKLRPGDEAPLTLWALTLRQQGRGHEAIPTLTAAADDLRSAPSWVLLGQLQAAARLTAQAQASFSRALTLDPDHREALEGAAACALDAQDLPAACAALDRIARSGEPPPALLSGRLAAAQGRLAEAADLLTAAVAQSPGHVESLLAAGQTTLRLGQHAVASDYFERALLASPTNAQALLGAARARLSQGDSLGALRLMERLRPLDWGGPPSSTPSSGSSGSGEANAPIAPPPPTSDPSPLSPDAIEALLLWAEAARARFAPFAALAYAYEALASAPTHAEHLRLRDALLAEVCPSISWPSPDHWDSPWAWESSLSQLISYGRSEPLLAPWMPAAAQLQMALDTPLQVAIMGEFNAGKSTFINTYLGESVVPTGVLPTTAHLNHVRYGAQRAARVIRRDGLVEVMAFEAVRAALSRLGDDAVEHVDFLYPHPQLRRVNLVDTPGFNAVNEAHEALAMRALSDADAIVWLIDANQALSQTQREVLAKIPGGADKTLIVLNKIDALDPEDLAEILAFTRANAQGLARAVVPISALRALSSQRQALRDAWDAEQAAAALAPTGWPSLLTALDAELIDRSAKLKVAHLRRHLRDLIRDASDDADQHALRLASLSDQLAQGRQALSLSLRQLLSRDLPQAHERFQAQLSLLLSAVAREVEDARHPSAGWLSPLTLDPEDMADLLGVLRDRLRAALTHTEQHLQRLTSDATAGVAQTLSAVAQRLSPPQSRLLLDRLERFAAEEQLLLQQLHTQLHDLTLQHLDGRLWLPAHDPALARSLGDEGLPESDRKQTLSRWVGDDLPLRVSDTLRRWAQAYFDASLRLCDNVRRDVEQLRLELLHRVQRPLSDLPALDTPPDTASPL